MHHIDLHAIAKHHDSTHLDHPVKEGDWIKGGHLVHHKAGFFGSHLAGTFHHAHSGPDLSLPSDHLVALKLLP